MFDKSTAGPSRGARIAIGIVVAIAVRAGVHALWPSTAEAQRPYPGMCLSELPPEGHVTGCAESHGAEVIAVLDQPPGSGYPTGLIPRAAQQQCLDRFRDYVGENLFGSHLTLGYGLPDRDVWERGDRLITCMLADDSGTLTGSQRGSGGQRPDQLANERFLEALAVGDCFMNPPDDMTSILTVEVRACPVDHDREMFARFDLAGNTLPTQSVIDDQAEARCVDEFEQYVGTDFDHSTLDVFWFYPLEEGWRMGDHAIFCLLGSLDGSPLSGSMRDAHV